MSNAKISIRFFNDREVRAVWDEQNAKWWFSVLDIVALLTDQDDYTKTRNYWKYLKAKLKKEKNELVSATTQLKLLANDGKRYLTDMLDYTGIIALGKEFPGKKANRFIEWFTYSDESIGGKSKTKAYAMFESSFFDSIEVGTTSDRKNLPNDSQTLFKKHITTNLFQDLEGLTNTIESYNCIEPLITRTSCGLQDLAGSLGCAISPLAAPRFFILE